MVIKFWTSQCVKVGSLLRMIRVFFFFDFPDVSLGLAQLESGYISMRFKLYICCLTIIMP